MSMHCCFLHSFFKTILQEVNEEGSFYMTSKPYAFYIPYQPMKVMQAGRQASTYVLVPMILCPIQQVSEEMLTFIFLKNK